jgi:hypothetical protein
MFALSLICISYKTYDIDYSSFLVYFRVDFKSKYKEFRKNIKGLLPKERMEQIVDLKRYSKDDEDKIEKIKRHICKICEPVRGRERRSCPAKWMEFEEAIEIMKSEKLAINIGVFLKLIDDIEAEKQREVKIWDVEIHDMLHYFHENGIILYFNMEKMREIVILNIQKFVDCFKHIITDEGHAKEDNAMVDKNIQGKWRQFHDRGFLDAELYEELIKKKASNLPEKDRGILGEYLQRLGIMFYIEKDAESEERKTWYVPSANKEHFKPKVETYTNDASPILAFRFEDFLPMDFFGRMLVLCLNSGKWQPVGNCFYKQGAHMMYDGDGNDGLEVYLFTSRNVITVQVQNLKEQIQYGKALNVDMQNIIQELLNDVFARSVECKIGFLCRKEKGYQESSVDHFIDMNIKLVRCDTCKSTDGLKEERKDAQRFWTDNPEQVIQLASNYQEKCRFRKEIVITYPNPALIY